MRYALQGECATRPFDGVLDLSHGRIIGRADGRRLMGMYARFETVNKILLLLLPHGDGVTRFYAAVGGGALYLDGAYRGLSCTARLSRERRAEAIDLARERRLDILVDALTRDADPVNFTLTR